MKNIQMSSLIILKWLHDVLTFYNYVTTFYSVVLVSCVQPVNWSSCVAVWDWVPPYVDDFKGVYVGKTVSIGAYVPLKF